MAHLLGTGRRRVAYLGDDLGIVTAEERYRGFRDALGSAGLPLDDGLVRHGLRTAEQARKAAHELVTSQRPDAVFASQNLVTLGAVEALHDLGRQEVVRGQAGGAEQQAIATAEREPGHADHSDGPGGHVRPVRRSGRHDVRRGLTRIHRAPLRPVDALDVIGENDPGHGQAGGHGDLERVAFRLVGDRADDA